MEGGKIVAEKKTDGLRKKNNHKVLGATERLADVSNTRASDENTEQKIECKR